MQIYVINEPFPYTKNYYYHHLDKALLINSFHYFFYLIIYIVLNAQYLLHRLVDIFTMNSEYKSRMH